MRKNRLEILMAALFLALTLLISVSAAADEALEERVDQLRQRFRNVRLELPGRRLLVGDDSQRQTLAPVESA